MFLGLYSAQAQSSADTTSVDMMLLPNVWVLHAGSVSRLGYKEPVVSSNQHASLIIKTDSTYRYLSRGNADVVEGEWGVSSYRLGLDKYRGQYLENYPLFIVRLDENNFVCESYGKCGETYTYSYISSNSANK